MRPQIFPRPVGLCHEGKVGAGWIFLAHKCRLEVVVRT